MNNPQIPQNPLIPEGGQIVNPGNQIQKLYSKPSFGMDGGIQVLNQPPQYPPQIYRGHRRKFGRTYINILHDPRVIRGNTYSSFIIPSSLQMEFLRMKEEEEKRKKLMRIPKKLPRVAMLGKGKKLEEDMKVKEIKKPESAIYRKMERIEDVDDKPYFYEDRPPTPQYVPMPAGKDEYTQIIDGELFDFDMEVKPILEVLVGRSVIQAQYELIEEYEREQYLNHKKEYEKKREFKLNNLQRVERKYVRKQEEKQRRIKQEELRKINDIMMQKKFMCRVFSKMSLNKLKANSLRYLQERGFLKPHTIYPVSFYVKQDYYPVAEKVNSLNTGIEDTIFDQIKSEVNNELERAHKESVDKEHERIRLIKEEIAKRKADEAEQKRKDREAQLERREQRRIARITKNIKEKIISTKTVKRDVLTTPLADIDEFSIKPESIYSLGGKFGEMLFVLYDIYKNSIPNEEQIKIDVKDFFRKFFDEFLLKGVTEIPNDSFILDLYYLESPKYDFENIAEERKKEYVEFVKDERRYISTSVHKMIDLGIIDKSFVNAFNEVISEIYFFTPKEPEKVEADPEKQEPEYLEQIKKQQEENEAKANELNAKMDKIKKKIKINILKPEIFKKKRNNIGGFVTVIPNDREFANIVEVEQVPVVKEKVEEEQPVEGGENPEGENKPAENPEGGENKPAEGENKPAEEAKPAEGENKPAEEAKPAEGENKPVEGENKPAEGEENKPAEEKKEGEEVKPEEEKKEEEQIESKFINII